MDNFKLLFLSAGDTLCFPIPLGRITAELEEVDKHVVKEGEKGRKFKIIQ